ncbi:transferase [Terrihabitans soli]|uniref:Transferase n=1 Tax=Terrihabitans soli TaxID=708113 RepID=A0A6S6QNB0_9HYPH|nr:rhodanese-like domain-containing protein [Terrihabitans soli]BCJ90439.1 transferase [Terrihabitans soli]
MNVIVKNPTATVDAKTVRDWLADGKEIAFFDVREEGEFGWGHPLLAANLPYSRLELDIERFVPHKNTRTVLIGADNNLPAIAAARLTALGYSNLHIVAGGIEAWKTAGLKLFEGVYVPSKAFAEVVEHAYHTPPIEAEDLKKLIDEKADFVVLDSRTEEEFARFHVPGAISVPGAELVHRVADLVPSPDKLVVVSCAGRTRGIMGAQSLINAGIPNKVRVLKGGTQGWRLAKLDVETGERFSTSPTDAGRKTAKGWADALAAQHGVGRIAHDELAKWRKDAARTTYVIDVRTKGEYAKGHLAGATHVPGAQLLQATDTFIPVHRARVVLVDDDGVRATVTAHWLKQLGWDVHVLDKALDGQKIVSGEDETRKIWQPDVQEIAPKEARAWLGDKGRLISVTSSDAYRKERPSGAVWSIRPRLLSAVGDLVPGARVLVIGDEEGVSALAASDLREAGFDAAIVAGGVAAWKAAGLPPDTTPSALPDAERIDFLTWNWDRHFGNAAASRAYLNWELDLPRQIEEDGTAYYKIKVPAGAAH